MDHQHTKSLSTDSRSKNRIRYASTRERAKRASADVYRSYKRRIGVTSAASREERVHHPDASAGKARKKRKTTYGDIKSAGSIRGEKKATLVRGGDTEESLAEVLSSDDEFDGGVESCFASELDLAQDRNASELYGKFYREIWPLTRSLAEMLHHASEIIAILMCYLLSPESAPNTATRREDVEHLLSPGDQSNHLRKAYIVNLVTTDVLHLIGVLARDFRHEIHRFVHPAIVPRIVYDLLNPPPPPLAESNKRQQLPLNVVVVEAAFRALSYVFRYDSLVLCPSTGEVGQRVRKLDLQRTRTRLPAGLELKIRWTSTAVLKAAGPLQARSVIMPGKLGLRSECSVPRDQ